MKHESAPRRKSRKTVSTAIESAAVSPSDCEPEWLLPSIPKDEQHVAATWEYARECPELRAATEIWRRDFEQAEREVHELAWRTRLAHGFAGTEIENFGSAALSKRVNIERHAANAAILNEWNGGRFSRFAEFPNTPWLALEPAVRRGLSGRAVGPDIGRAGKFLIEEEDPIAIFCGDPCRVVCEIGQNRSLPPFWYHKIPLKLGRNTTTALLHFDLDANLEDAVSAFRRIFPALKERNGIRIKSVGRKSDVPKLGVPLDRLKALGALRLVSMKNDPPFLAQYGQRLGYRHDQGKPLQETANSVLRAAAKACVYFQAIFPASEGPLHTFKA